MLRAGFRFPVLCKLFSHKYLGFIVAVARRVETGDERHLGPGVARRAKGFDLDSSAYEIYTCNSLAGILWEVNEQSPPYSRKGVES